MWIDSQEKILRQHGVDPVVILDRDAIAGSLAVPALAMRNQMMITGRIGLAGRYIAKLQGYTRVVTADLSFERHC